MYNTNILLMIVLQLEIGKMSMKGIISVLTFDTFITDIFCVKELLIILP